MSTRFLIPGLCIGAVAFACGPRPHNEASVSKKAPLVTAQAAVAQQQGAALGKTHPKGPVSADLYVRATPQSVRLALHVVNTSKKRIELQFPSGQTYDFVILDSLDREVWRWARGRMFTQTLRNTLLSGGESLDVDETFDATSLPPGRYTARAHLTSQNFPVEKQTEFRIAGTTVASR